MKNNQKLLRGEDVAVYLNISRSQAFKLMRTGLIRTVRFGRLVRVREEDLEDFVSRSLSASGQTSMRSNPHLLGDLACEIKKSNDRHNKTRL